MRASRWGGRFGCLEVTYEESKREEPGHGLDHAPGLEVTYEESKRALNIAYDVVVVGLEVTYEESKPLPPGRGLRPHRRVWKLPMRNPS